MKPFFLAVLVWMLCLPAYALSSQERQQFVLMVEGGCKMQYGAQYPQKVAQVHNFCHCHAEQTSNKIATWGAKELLNPDNSPSAKYKDVLAQASQMCRPLLLQ